MKKFLVSTVVVVSFVAYSMYQRIYGAQTMPIISPQSTPSTVSQTLPTNTPTPTSLPTPTSAPLQSTHSQPQPDARQPLAQTPTPTPTPSSRSGYKDGTYSGDAADAFYGNIQVQAIIQSGKITNVQFLQAPNDRNTSIYINSQADPLLAQEAIQTQSANVNIVSGATDSSNAFIQSLQSALDKAKA